MFTCGIRLHRRYLVQTARRYSTTKYSSLKLPRRSLSTAIPRMADNSSLPRADLEATVQAVRLVAQPDPDPDPVPPSASTATATNISLKSTNPLIWIDCEMTGLVPPHDKLLQIACFITDSQLNLLEPTGFETVISRPKDLLDSMDDWCTTTHTSTGLIPRVLASKVTVSDASEALLDYIKTYVPDKRTAIMCGNSIHFDKLFLSIEMPEVVEWLSYRVGDVSSIKEFARRWCSEEVLAGLPVKKYTHEAKEDILESIEEARYYRRVLFGGEAQG